MTKYITCILIHVAILAMFIGPASGQKACKTPMPQSQFDPYLGAIKGESFTSNQMEVAKQASKCFSTAQIRQVMDIFSFEESKLEFAKWAFPRCTDKGNYFTLNSGLTYSSSKSDLNQFVNSQATEEETETPDEEVVINPPPVKPRKNPVKPTVKQPVRKTGWEPGKQDYDWDKENKNPADIHSEAYKNAMKQMDAFFVMTFGKEETVVKQEEVHKADENDATLSPKQPRIVITEPTLNEENNFSANVKTKRAKVSGVISSSIGIYEVFVNETEAVLNQKGEFFAEIPLGMGENMVHISAKDTKGQVAKIGFKINRNADDQPAVVTDPVVPKLPEKEPVKPDPNFVSEVAKDIPKLPNVNKNAIAVVIGNSKYTKAKPVDFAVNDARIFKQYLTNMLGFKEGNILYYENASLGDMNTVFGTKGNPKGKLFNTIKQGVSDVIIFYSGHGAPGLKDNKAYFVPVESDPNYMENSGYSIDVLYDNLKLLPAKTITFFSDACFSGANVFDKISPMVIRSKEPVKEGLKNTTLMNSCTGTEVSCWNNEEKHGLFTFYLLKAMKDYQTTDINKDKQVTLGEIFSSLSDNNEGVPYYARRNYGLTQTPVVQGNKNQVLFKY